MTQVILEGTPKQIREHLKKVDGNIIVKEVVPLQPVTRTRQPLGKGVKRTAYKPKTKGKCAICGKKKAKRNKTCGHVCGAKLAWKTIRKNKGN
jgi:hypothetical protein